MIAFGYYVDIYKEQFNIVYCLYNFIRNSFYSVSLFHYIKHLYNLEMVSATCDPLGASNYCDNVPEYYL